jgi:glycosyltransferase involved in cell wall biosynthesis
MVQGRPGSTKNIDSRIPVSVVIPCFCCADTIERALSSVAEQTALPVEVILVEDASPDEGKTLNALRFMASRYGDFFGIKIIALTVNGGAGTARNRGWEVASQPYIAFLDADDSWHPDKLRRQYAYMAAHPDIVLSGHLCSAEVRSGKATASMAEQTISTRTIPPFQWLVKNAFSTPTVMLRRDIPHRFTDGRRYGEDFLLWQQIAFSGKEVVRLEAPLAQVHKPFYGAGGLSADLWKMEQGELANFALLRRDGYISSLAYLFASAFSLLKFVRRWALVHIRSGLVIHR